MKDAQNKYAVADSKSDAMVEMSLERFKKEQKTAYQKGYDQAEKVLIDILLGWSMGEFPRDAIEVDHEPLVAEKMERLLDRLSPPASSEVHPS